MDKCVEKKSALSWALYHFASNSFATTIMATLLPIYFSQIAASSLSNNEATTIWGYANSLALIIATISSPILGALATSFPIKKMLLFFFMLIGSILSGLLYFTTSGDWILASTLFILGSASYTLSLLFHNALLPHVATPQTINTISSVGYALGYLGGGILLALNILTILLMNDKENAMRLSFVSVAIWWFVFTLPLMLFVKEPSVHSAAKNPLKLLFSTCKKMGRYKELALFLIAFLIYNDGIGTIIKMATIYGKEIGIGNKTLILALLMTQFVGIPFSFAFAFLAKKIGAKRCIYLGLLAYTLISIGAYFMTKPIEFWILAFLVGTVQGGTQALSVSFFGNMLPKAKTAEFFGFFSRSSKVGGFLGPLCFALISQVTGNSRYGVLSLVIFFALGALLLSLVNEEDGIKKAREEDASML